MNKCTQGGSLSDSCIADSHTWKSRLTSTGLGGPCSMLAGPLRWSAPLFHQATRRRMGIHVLQPHVAAAVRAQLCAAATGADVLCQVPEGHLELAELTALQSALTFIFLRE